MEESFNTQATHDILFLPAFPPSSLAAYDHRSFPGAVPRTFWGPLLLALPLHLVLPFLPPSLRPATKLPVQLGVRVVLALFLWAALLRFRQAAASRFGPRTGQCLLLLTLSQFHLPFYVSRTLPNTFALGFVLLAYASLLYRAPTRCLFYLAGATALFRCDVIVLALPLLLLLLLRRHLKLSQLLLLGALFGGTGIVVSVLLDSYFWRAGREEKSSAFPLLWPEGVVLFFNAVENRSIEWGASPWHWYVSSALPRSLLTSPLLWPYCFLARRKERRGTGVEGAKGKSLDEADKDRGVPVSVPLPFLPQPLRLDLEPFLLLFLPVALYLALYSFLPHKELRFIFPALPVLNLCAAIGWARLEEKEGGRRGAMGQTGRPGLGVETRGTRMSLRKRKKEGVETETQEARKACGVKHQPKQPEGGEKAVEAILPSSPSSRPLSFLLRHASLLGWLVVTSSLLPLPLFLAAARRNYPGGDGLARFHAHVFAPNSSHADAVYIAPGGREGEGGGKDRVVKLHIGVLAAQTGVSRFGEVWEKVGSEGGTGKGVGVRYSKEEGLSLSARMRRFDYLLAEREEAEEMTRRARREEGGTEVTDVGGERRHCEVVEWVQGRPRLRKWRESLHMLGSYAASLWDRGGGSMSIHARKLMGGKSGGLSQPVGWEDVLVETEAVLALVACRMRDAGGEEADDEEKEFGGGEEKTGE